MFKKLLDWDIWLNEKLGTSYQFDWRWSGTVTGSNTENIRIYLIGYIK